MTPRCLRFVVLASVWIVAATASACKLPVFRYALERWTVDRYRMVAIVDDRESDTVREALAELQSLAGSNANGR